MFFIKNIFSVLNIDCIFGKNPTINYSTPGMYTATLIAVNATGADTLTKIAYISVQAINSIPLQEGFAGNFPPPFWTFVDAGNDVTIIMGGSTTLSATGY